MNWTRWHIRSVFIMFLILLATSNPLYAQEEILNVFDRWIAWSDGGHMLIRHLNWQAFDLLEKRDSRVSELATAQDWADRQKIIRHNLMQVVGPFPEKTPLNARITGILRKDGFRVEKIVYESMPGLHVTACLFIPDGLRGKPPAIIHSAVIRRRHSAAFHTRPLY